jgi:hypothetical protein
MKAEKESRLKQKHLRDFEEDFKEEHYFKEDFRGRHCFTRRLPCRAGSADIII